MSYERLELIDGVTKWDTEKVQHLEDAIIKNENDIQKYHNDIIAKTQADWDQNDETAPDYIKNRTHYSYLDQDKNLLFDEYDSEMYNSYNYLPYTQVIQSDLIETDCPGYWLGKEAGYWVNIGDPYNSVSYLLDAYSDWKKVGEEDNIIIYQ